MHEIIHCNVVIAKDWTQSLEMYVKGWYFKEILLGCKEKKQFSTDLARYPGHILK